MQERGTSIVNNKQKQANNITSEQSTIKTINYQPSPLSKQISEPSKEDLLAYSIHDLSTEEHRINSNNFDFNDSKNPCSVHALLDPYAKKSNFRKNSLHSENTDALARTAVAVRSLSKQLAKRRIKFHKPRTVLVVTKPGDKKLIPMAKELVIYLLNKIKIGDEFGLTVYIDKHLSKSPNFQFQTIQKENNSQNKNQILLWTESLVKCSPQTFDFVITLGGDGTVLYTSWLFQTIVPAVIPFHLGSLGFLTTFEFQSYQDMIQSSFDEGVRINMRMRFSCTIFRFNNKKMSAIEENTKKKNKLKFKNHGQLLFETTTKPIEEDMDYLQPNTELPLISPYLHNCDTLSSQGFEKDVAYQILNDLVVDRGPSPFMAQLELFGDGEPLTTVQADGLTVATPTGSTAYSLAAGGSLVHPEIPALLITPICPHSLSFRPMLLPDSTTLDICVPFNSRGTAWASFDGRGRVELKRGDFIRVVASKFPFPTVCASGTQSRDWFKSLNRCLLWNQRLVQKSISSYLSSTDSSDNENDSEDKEINLNMNSNRKQKDEKELERQRDEQVKIQLEKQVNQFQ